MDTKLLKRRERSIIGGCFLFDSTPQTFVNNTIEDERCILVSLKQGEALSDVLEYRRRLGLILSGMVEATKISDKRYVMKRIAAGGVFGAASLFDKYGESYVTELVALRDTRICFFSDGLLRSMMLADFSVAENYMRFLTGRIRLLNDKIQGLIYTSSDAALAHFLLCAYNDSGGMPCIKPGFSLSALAEELNIGRASLYRSFAALESGGLIEKKGREIIIRNADGLKAVASPETEMRKK